MTLKSDIQDQIARLQAELVIVNRIPDDTFSFGTVVIFSSASGSHWYYVKTGEEAWRAMANGANSGTKQLSTWIFEATQTNIGYFEVYTLTPAATPIFTSA